VCNRHQTLALPGIRKFYTACNTTLGGGRGLYRPEGPLRASAWAVPSRSGDPISRKRKLSSELPASFLRAVASYLVGRALDLDGVNVMDLDGREIDPQRCFPEVVIPAKRGP